MTRIIIRPTGGFSTVPPARPSEIDWEEPDLIPFAPEPARPSVRDAAPVKNAQRLAEVARAMKDHDLDRRDAERLLKIESEMDGSDWASRHEGEQS
jgi:hypothetical protein